MLLEIKKLNIQNEGYKRNITLEKMYINAANIVSIINYEGAKTFLLRENSRFSQEKFSLIKLNEGSKVEEIIAFGAAEELYASLSNTSPGKRLLND